MGNGLSTDQGSFTPHGLRDVAGTGAEQRQHDWSNPAEDDNMLAGAPNNEELNSLSTSTQGIRLMCNTKPAISTLAPNAGLGLHYSSQHLHHCQSRSHRILRMDSRIYEQKKTHKKMEHHRTHRRTAARIRRLPSRRSQPLSLIHI